MAILEGAMSALRSAASAFTVKSAGDEDSRVRRLAVQTLGELEPAELATHGDALVAKLEDEDSGVRWAAAHVLGKLEPAELAKYGDALVATLEDHDPVVRSATAEALGQLEPAELAKHGDALVATLESEDSDMRRAAVELLGKLEPAELAKHGDALVATLEDRDIDVRLAAAEAVDKLQGELSYTEPSCDLSAKLQVKDVQGNNVLHRLARMKLGSNEDKILSLCALMVKHGVDIDDRNTLGTTARDIGMASSLPTVKSWFAQQGCFMGRYRLLSRAAHRSRTSVIFYATDISAASEAPVALKLMRERADLQVIM